MACILGLGFWEMGPATSLSAGALLAQERMQRTWDHAQGGARSPRWTAGAPVARLVAKGGEIDLVVLPGDAQRFELAPEHLPTTPLPGQSGNSVIAGRADTHFRFLQDLAVGEALWLETPDGMAHTYQIVHLDIMDARRSGVLLDSEASMLTLVSNFPFDAGKRAGTLRYVVTARKCP